jgi:hypothetical protein
MSEPEKPKPRFWQMHLSTAILLMFAAPIGALVIVRSNAWTPEPKPLTPDEFEARFPGWLQECLKEKPRKHLKSPDGTREMSTASMDNSIHVSGNMRYEGLLFDFTIRDFDSDLKFNLGTATDATPIHHAIGFVDDNNCVMLIFGRDRTPYFRIWHRRYPEWWWGQLYRPEVWAAIVLGAVLLWKVFLKLKVLSKPIIVKA